MARRGRPVAREHKPDRDRSDINSEGLIHRSEICLSEADILADADEQIATSKKCGYCVFCSVVVSEKSRKKKGNGNDDGTNDFQPLINETGRHYW